MLNILVLFLVAFLGGTQSDCDVCQEGNFVACHSETVFSLCVEGAPTLDYITCPKDHHCTPDNYVCYPNTEGVRSCPRKNLNEILTNTTPETTIPTTTTPTTTTPETTTPETTIPTTTTPTTTTPTTTIPTTTALTTTTPAPQLSPLETCQTEQVSDSFKNNDDPTCTSYVQCYRQITWQALIMVCDANQWFDDTLRICQSVKPPGCE